MEKRAAEANEILSSLVWTINSIALALFMDGNMTLIN